MLHSTTTMVLLAKRALQECAEGILLAKRALLELAEGILLAKRALLELAEGIFLRKFVPKNLSASVLKMVRMVTEETVVAFSKT